jgi:hypothetical protein
MKLKATDSLHVSNVSADAIRPGQTFDLEDGEARDLVRRGLATEVAAPKKEAAPATRAKKPAEKPAENKGSVATETK